jgi:hypothetical protein
MNSVKTVDNITLRATSCKRMSQDSEEGINASSEDGIVCYFVDLHDKYISLVSFIDI